MACASGRISGEDGDVAEKRRAQTPRAAYQTQNGEHVFLHPAADDVVWNNGRRHEENRMVVRWRQASSMGGRECGGERSDASSGINQCARYGGGRIDWRPGVVKRQSNVKTWLGRVVRQKAANRVNACLRVHNASTLGLAALVPALLSAISALDWRSRALFISFWRILSSSWLYHYYAVLELFNAWRWDSFSCRPDFISSSRLFTSIPTGAGCNLCVSA